MLYREPQKLRMPADTAGMRAAERGFPADSEVPHLEMLGMDTQTLSISGSHYSVMTAALCRVRGLLSAAGYSPLHLFNSPTPAVVAEDHGQGLHKVWLAGKLWEELCLLARLSALVSS